MSAKLWESLTPKYVYAESVRQVLDYVSRGEVDAGLVYATDAFIGKGKVKIVATVPGHKPVTYPIALLKASASKDLGAKFVSYVLSPKGLKILADFGFKTP